MARCSCCPSNDADPDQGACFECFCANQPVYPEQEYPQPNEAELCGASAHSEYEPHGQCYCGAVKYAEGKRVEQNDKPKGE